MRRLFLLLTLSTLACGLLTSTPSPVPATPPPTDPPTASPSPTVTPPKENTFPTATPRKEVTRFPDPAGFEWVPIAIGLYNPTDIQSAGDGSGRLFVLEQNGRIRIVQKDQLQFKPFLDITNRVDDGSNEQGLLGLAFHPDFANNGFFFVNYTKQGGDTVIARFTASGNTADPNSEVRLLEVNQPFPNHNGGALAFGPDGYLYIGLGDGGAAGDPLGNGQKLSTLLGKVLRIDVDNGDPYSIPADNPFGNEIWAYGLRNPWRISFDSLTGDLWFGDVGQNVYEEINFVPAGTPGGINFGWNRYEGFHIYKGEGNLPNYRPPIFEYSHQEAIGGCSVSGGYVYRGSMPEWDGIYFFGDYCTGNVWAVLHILNGTGETFNTERLFQVQATITTFGVDEDGELYIASRDGTVYRLERR